MLLDLDIDFDRSHTDVAGPGYLRRTGAVPYTVRPTQRARWRIVGWNWTEDIISGRGS